jgi:hypothetical protein
LLVGSLACTKNDAAASGTNTTADRAETKIKKGAKATGDALGRAAHAVERGVKKGAAGVKKGGEAVGDTVNGK